MPTVCDPCPGKRNASFCVMPEWIVKDGAELARSGARELAGQQVSYSRVPKAGTRGTHVDQAADVCHPTLAATTKARQRSTPATKTCRRGPRRMGHPRSFLPGPKSGDLG